MTSIPACPGEVGLLALATGEPDTPEITAQLASDALGLDDRLRVPLDRASCRAHAPGGVHHAHARRLKHVGDLHLHLHRQPARLGRVLDAKYSFDSQLHERVAS